MENLDLAALEAFETELIRAGFEPLPHLRGGWEGPIAPALTGLTGASSMRILFEDGWPFVPPHLCVEGLDGEHVSAGGIVCLWDADATPEGWLTLSAFMDRIALWAERAACGFALEDFALDAHRFFVHLRSDTLATVNLHRLGLDEAGGGHGRFSGAWDAARKVLAIAPGRGGEIEGHGYLLSTAPEHPPRTLEEVRRALGAGQRNNFERRLKAVSKSGELRLFLVVWDRKLGREALLLSAVSHEGELRVEAIEVAPMDERVLKLRAGPDVSLLADKRICLFGSGAIGSHAALTVAECGLGHLVLVDADRLRPGNVVRHVCGAFLVGLTKVRGTSDVIEQHAPWTRVVGAEESPCSPSRVRALWGKADLVIDTTGAVRFSALLAQLCHDDGLPLLSAALYREGAVGRVRRQCPASEAPLWERTPPRYPLVPAGEDPPPRFETGCSAPVNNASPLAVKGVAALLAESAIDLLTGRSLLPEERLVVYRPLEEPPFDRIGPVAV